MNNEGSGVTWNVNEYIEERSREIVSIEERIKKTKKKLLLFQRPLYYSRRRNRCYAGRKKRKQRKKDRHFLKTHTFYAKRFLMIKIGEGRSIPLRRRLKSSKYIYKSQKRGFVFDESFRKCYTYSLDMVKSNVPQILSKLNNEVMAVDNEYEMVVDGDKVVVIGGKLEFDGEKMTDCVISVMLKDSIPTEVKGKIYRRKDGALETYKIICPRNTMMENWMALVTNGLIPIGLEEIHRLSLENDVWTIYDKIGTPLYSEIEKEVNKLKIDRYNRTPPSKRQIYDTNKLFLSRWHPSKYILFRILKGHCSECAEILLENVVVGYVVRSGFKYSSGTCCGLGFLVSDLCRPVDIFLRNLGQTNCYRGKITKMLDPNRNEFGKI